jgi:Ca2+/H+ antiporter
MYAGRITVGFGIGIASNLAVCYLKAQILMISSIIFAAHLCC